jgi:hypothetical protein
VYYFDGPIPSPLAGIGSRGSHATNRLALDDDRTTVSVDPQAHRIVFSNTSSYPSATIIGDLVLLGIGTDSQGHDIAFAVHLKLKKRQHSFTADLHPHPTSRNHLRALRVAPYTVVVRGASGETTVLTPEQARKTVEEPELAARLANLVIQATDNLEGRSIRPEQVGARLVDVSIGFGAQRLNLKVARIELISQDAHNATLVRGGSLADMLAHGAWEFRITSQTWLPPDEFNRDLFLFGLDSIAFLQPLTTRGLRRGESLAIGFRDGKGFVQLGHQRGEIANAADVARAYLEFHFVGGIVARQVTTLPQRLLPPSPAASP